MKKSHDNQTQLTFEEQFTIQKKFCDSTSTVDELRYGMFAPVNSITHNSKTAIELKNNKKITRYTNWGEITIEKTILTQKHKDLFDCIITYAKLTQLDNGDNAIAYEFSGQEMNRRYYGEDTTTKNLSQLDKMLTDMMSAVITMKANNGDKAKFQIFSFAGYSEERKSYLVKFNPDYVRFFANSLTINYSEELPMILKINEPIIKAIVRFSLTHKSTLKMRVYDPTQPKGKTGILEAVGFPIESPSQEKSAFKALKENVETLKHFGIYYNPSDKTTVRYKKRLDIKFIPQATHKKLVKLGVKEEDYYLKLQDFIGRKFIKNSETYEIKDIYLDLDKDKIIIACFLPKDEEQKVKKMEIANMPSEAYEWIKSEVIEE